MSKLSFTPDSTGYLRHWLVTDPHEAPYEGESGSDNEMRGWIVDEAIGKAPECSGLGSSGPHGTPWRYSDPARNIFIEQSAFWHELTVLNTYGATDLVAPADGVVEARFWSCGAGDLWVNGEHVSRHPVTRYMYPDVTSVTFPVKQGPNRLTTRVQALGVRDTRFLFGLQLIDPDGCELRLPGDAEVTDAFVAVDRWLNSIRAVGRNSLTADGAPPVHAVLRFGREDSTPWPAGKDTASFDVAHAKVTVALEIHDQPLERPFEFPANRTIATEHGTVDDTRLRYLEALADAPGRGRSGVMNVLARHTLGRRSDIDTGIIMDACDWIDGRPDCADFPLSALLRMYFGDVLTDLERDRIKRTALGFRYWPDEPGVDALCFNSENHSLLFHGCQMLAGRLFPGDVFTNSGRTGHQQEEIGHQRCQDWLDEKAEKGFVEFLSSTYIPLTVGALLNVVDFCDDEEMSNQAAHLVDRLFHQIAEHAFDGVTVGPQGRVYRNVLTPDASGTQALLAYAVPEVVLATSDWVSFVAASDRYDPPVDLADVVAAPVSRSYSEAAVEVHLEKTDHYLLTSLEIPAGFQNMDAQVSAPQSNPGLIPGRQGYQQHLWHATLGRDCHIFVNHPGASFDLSSSRPGFWYGNGHLPRLHQQGGALIQIFDTPDKHPIPFTHAHWPADILDEQEIREHWAFGRRNGGLIALWCSSPLAVCSDVLTDCELRAEGRRVAWACLCGAIADHGDLEAFAQRCTARSPSFNPATLSLEMQGVDTMVFDSHVQKLGEAAPAD